MASDVDEIVGRVGMWPLKLLRLEEFHDVATEVDAIGEDVVIWPPKLMRLEGMS